MSSSQSTNDAHGLTSLGVFAIIVGTIISTLLIGFLIGKLRRSLANNNRPCPVYSIPQTPSASDSEKHSRVHQGNVDLEAIVLPNSAIMPPQQRKLKTSSSNQFAKPGRPSFCSGTGSVARARYHHHRHGLSNRTKAKNAQISRPTRLLPLDSSYVIVKSPLSRNDRFTMIGSYIPIQTTRLTRARSLDSQLHKAMSNLDDIKANFRSDFPSQQSSPQTSSNPQLPRKRAIVWFDDPSSNETPETGSVISRSSRSYSLPSTNLDPRMSWQALSPGSEIGVPEWTSDYREAKSNLGPLSHLWLSYENNLSKESGMTHLL